jgi:Ca-activated chloride channel family protein
MKLNSLKSLFLAASFMMAPAAQAAGMIVIDPITPMPVMPVRPIGVRPVPIRPINPTPRPSRPVVLKGNVSFGLHLQAADVRVEIVDQVAKTYITQTFSNDTDRNLAGTYLFPLPEDTTFSSFSLHIDGKPVEGKILEAQEARQTYEDIVRRMVDPGLLEYADHKTVRARIFPIPAHGTKKVELEYTQLLKAENGLLKYRFPLKTETDGAAAEEVKVSVKLSSKQGLRTIWSPSHMVDTSKPNDHQAKVAYIGKDTVPDKDFLLYYSVSDKEVAANVLSHKTSSEDGYYLLSVTPPVEAKQAGAKDIVLVADTSGSMQGTRMEQNKKALKYLVNALNPADRFSIVEFNTDVEVFKPNVVQATPENKKAAIAFIDDLEARGGTNIGDALRNAVTMLDQVSDRPGYLVLMTDGEPTVGETTIPGLLKAVQPKRDIRVFDFGVGYDVNTKLLNKLAEAHHGTAQYVEPDESMETSLASFYQKIKAPVLSNVKIAYDGVQVKDVYPRNPKDIFAGTQVLLLGRYKGAANGTVKITGTVNGVAKAYSFPVSFAGNQAGNTHLPRLWAMRRIGHLTEVAQENGNNKEIVDEIIDLSKKHGIISAYTSYLVTEPGGVQPMPRPTSMPMMRGRALSAAPAAPSVAMGGSGGWRQEGADRGFALEQKKASFDMAANESAARFNLMSLSSAKVVGKEAVLRNKRMDELKLASNVVTPKNSEMPVKNIDDKTFYMKDGYWTDASFDGKIKATAIEFGSKEYFDLLKNAPGIGKYLAAGRQLVLMYNGNCYRIKFNQGA